MAGRIAYYGNIVKDGLVFDLDAAKRDSYPGGGTVWRDVSGLQNNGTLTNGPTFDSNNGGSIVFDGVDDYVTDIGLASTFSFIQNIAIFTIDVWVKPNVLGTAMYFMGNNNGSTGSKGFYLGKLSNNNSWIAATLGVGGQTVINYQSTNFYTDTNWVNIAITSNGTNAICYKNGVQFGSQSSNITTLSTGDSARALSVGRINNTTTSDYWNGKVAVSRIYNRPLSSSEVLQNYNALKGRYGL